MLKNKLKVIALMIVMIVSFTIPVVRAENETSTDGTSGTVDLSEYFASTQSVGSDNTNRLIDWTEACRAVNSF